MTIVNLRKRLLHPRRATDARAEFCVSCIMQQEK